MVWYGMVWYGLVWYGLVEYGMIWLMPTWLIEQRAGSGRGGGLYQVDAYSPTVAAIHSHHRFSFNGFSQLDGTRWHVCLAGRGRGRESSSEKYTRPRRSSGCQKRSQKSAKATTGLKGRPQQFIYGQLCGPGDLVLEGPALCKIGPLPPSWQGYWSFCSVYIWEPTGFGKCSLWPFWA